MRNQKMENKKTFLSTFYSLLSTSQRIQLVLIFSLICLSMLQAQADANEPPIALDASSKVIKDTQNSTLNRLTLRAYDPDGDPLTYYILDLPGHGILRDIETGNPIEPGPLDSNIVKYIPEPDYKGPDSFTFKAEANGEVSNIAKVKEEVVDWFAPIGIPLGDDGNPPFGINETHMMYAGIDSETGDYYKYNFVLDPSRGEEYYPDAGNGPYTHYVDYLIGKDDKNPYGTPNNPRRSIPYNLAAGSVVEIHNGSDGREYITATGTLDKPVFVRGNSPTDRVTMLRYVVVKDAYSIWENLSFHNRSFEVRPHQDSNAHHVALRNSEIYGDGKIDTGGSAVAGGVEGNEFHNIVFYNNHIHHNGDSEAEKENDRHGTVVGQAGYTEQVWIVDNHIHHNGGDSFQTGHGAKFTTHHIYVGRNIMHDDRENAVDIKQTNDVIVSQNIMYGYKDPKSAGPVVIHEGSKRHWILYNEMYDANDGVVSSGSSYLYVIGNIIYGMREYPGEWHEGANAYRTGSGIRAYSSSPIYAYHNTIYDVEVGLGFVLQGESYRVAIVNNIVSDVLSINPRGQEGYHLIVNGKGRVNSEVDYDLFFQDEGDTRFGWDYKTAVGLEAFKDLSGKGEHCLELNPKYIDAPNYNFHLLSDSPAIDNGTLVEAYQTFFDGAGIEGFDGYGIDIAKDFDGVPRPIDIKGVGGEGEKYSWDIGAYEYSPSGFRYGDVNGDGKVNHNDASLVLRYRVGKVELTPEQKRAADVSGNGEVTEFDAYLIGEYEVGNIECFPVEEGCGG